MQLETIDSRFRYFDISGRRSHGGAETRRKQREETTTRHKGNWRVPCFCLCVKHPWLPTGPQVFYTAPVIRPVRLCGCINISLAGKLMWCGNAGAGSMPYRMCDVCKKRAWSALGARRQKPKASPAFELSNRVRRQQSLSGHPSCGQ
jgi:hypothetical protein